MKGETKKHNNKELTQQPLNVVNDDTAEGRLVRIIKNLKWFQTENAHVHNTKQTNCSKRQHEQEAQMLRQLTFKTRKYGFFFYVQTLPSPWNSDRQRLYEAGKWNARYYHSRFHNSCSNPCSTYLLLSFHAQGNMEQLESHKQRV